MKIHPLVWLGIADYLQRKGDGLLLLHGAPRRINRTFDVPISGNLAATVVDRNFLTSKLNQLQSQGQLKGFVVFKQNGSDIQDGSHNDGVHSVRSQSILAQLIEIHEEYSSSYDLYVLEIDIRDFQNDRYEQLSTPYNDLEEFRSNFYRFDTKVRSLVAEKLLIEAFDPEKSAINSIINNEANKDNLHSLNSVVQEKKHSLQVFDAKVGRLIQYLQEGAANGEALDQDIVNEIGGIVSLLEGGEAGQGEEDSVVVQSFYEKKVDTSVSALLSLISVNLAKNSNLVDKNLELYTQL